MKKIILTVILGLLPLCQVQAEGEGILPANPSDGTCYAQVFTPPQVESSEVAVVVREGYTEYDITPAIFSSEDTVVVTRPAWQEHVESPPVFEVETVTEPYDKGAYWSLEQCSGSSQIACYHDEGKVSDSGNTITYTVTKVIQDAFLDTIDHPEETTTVKVYTLVSPSRVVTRIVRPKVSSIPVSVYTSPGELTWVKGDCGASTQPVPPVGTNSIRDIQTMLNNELPGCNLRVDGIWGPATAAAHEKYKNR